VRLQIEIRTIRIYADTDTFQDGDKDSQMYMRFAKKKTINNPKDRVLKFI